jgi:glutamate-ammonia-ligase adenylyltransferase
LVRARPVAGDRRLSIRFSEIRNEILALERDPDKLQKDVREMRERMRTELVSKDPKIFDLKQGVGGLTDIEFLVQYGVLRWAHEFPKLRDYTDNIRILEGFYRYHLIRHEDAEMLSDIYRDYRTRIHRLTLREESAEVDVGEFQKERDRVTAIWDEWLGLAG